MIEERLGVIKGCQSEIEITFNLKKFEELFKEKEHIENQISNT